MKKMIAIAALTLAVSACEDPQPQNPSPEMPSEPITEPRCAPGDTNCQEP